MKKSIKDLIEVLKKYPTKTLEDRYLKDQMVLFCADDLKRQDPEFDIDAFIKTCGGFESHVQ